jgi:hypothetical protein
MNNKRKMKKKERHMEGKAKEPALRPMAYLPRNMGFHL